jgi:outer membrane protein
MKKFRAALPALFLAFVAVSAHAQHAGDNVITAGWFHIAPQYSSTSITTNTATVPINTPLGLPSSFSSPGTGLSTNDANTLGIVFSHFLTDNIAVTTVAGIPPEFQLYGHGTIMPPGPAGALGSQNLSDPSNNPIVKKVREWSPAIMLQYYFNTATSRFRPYVGLGIAYNFFTGIELNPQFQASTSNNLGSVLAAGAGKPGPTSVSASSTRSLSPLFNVGASYALNKHWAITAAVSYIPFKTTATTKIHAADGTLLATSKADLSVDPIVTFVALSYRF